MFVQVFPPSKDLNAPVPAKELLAIRFSPVPIQTVSGSERETSISPMAKVDSFSKMGFQVIPLLTVFQTFPDPTPTYIVELLPGGQAILSTLPPWNIGPTLRQLRFLKGESSLSFTWRFQDFIRLSGSEGFSLACAPEYEGYKNCTLKRNTLK